MRKPQTLVDVLAARVQDDPERAVYTFLKNGEEVEGALSAEQLEADARRIAARLGAEGLYPGARALLLFPSGRGFITAFLGCLVSGVVAVPAYPPRRGKVEQRLPGMVQDCHPTAVLCSAPVLSRRDELCRSIPALGEVPWVCPEMLEESEEEQQRVNLRAEDLAFLQYTSGSTGSPKGVMVSHGNLMANEEMIRRAFGQSEDSVVVGWLPLFHDMGLIGNVLQPLYSGGQAILMSPAAFLQRPARWLEAVHQFRACTSGGPNFAWELCVDRMDEESRAALDLSCWKIAFNGAEPVRAATLERFAAAFAISGFQRRSFYPCYGLAEATLFVTGGEEAEEPVILPLDAGSLEMGQAKEGEGEEAVAMVGSGRPYDGLEVEIVDPQSLLTGEAGAIGEIWVRGETVAKGYWGQEDLSHEIFGARRQDRPQAGPYLRTGDLGFLAGGELFITGRHKDLIILRGRNLYPQDLESVAEASHSDLRPGCSAAFSVGGEADSSLVLVAELGRRALRNLRQEQAAGIVAAVKEAVASAYEARVGSVVLIRPGSLPKTSSGKIRRRECRRLFLDDGLATVGFQSPAPRKPLRRGRESSFGEIGAADGDRKQRLLLEHLLALVSASVQAPHGVDPDASLAQTGLDSLAAIELCHRLTETLGVQREPADLLAAGSPRDLASALLREVGPRTPLAMGEEASLPEEEGPQSEVGDFPLTHGQRALWFLQRLAPEAIAYNLAMAAEIRGPLSEQAFAAAFYQLLTRHPALRTRFPEVEGEPVQRIGRERGADLDLISIDAEALDRRARAALLRREARRPFRLAQDPPLRLRLLRLGPKRHVFLLVVHHLVADLWSLALLMGELDCLYQGLLAAAPPALPAPGVGMGSWAQREHHAVAGPRGQALKTYWKEALEGAPLQLELPTDAPRPPVQTWSGATVRARLTAASTSRLRALAGEIGVTPYMLLLAAFQTLLGRLSGQDDLLVGSPIAGREASVARTVGYLAQPVVLRADLSAAPSFRRLLARTRKRTLAAFRHGAYPFGLLVDALGLEREPSRPPVFQVFFAWQQIPSAGLAGLSAFAVGEPGEVELCGQSWRPLPVETGSTPFELALQAAPLGEDIALSLDYNRDLFEATTMERLLAHLRHLTDALLADPEAVISAAGLLGKAEREEILALGRGAASAVIGAESRAGSHPCLGAWFWQQAERCPERIALSFDPGPDGGRSPT